MIDRPNESLQATDGKHFIHLNYEEGAEGGEPSESSFKTHLRGLLTSLNYSPSDLHNAYLSVTGFTFSPHWLLDRGELIISLDTPDCDSVRLVDSGLGQEGPKRRLLYIDVELSKRRMVILKREALARRALNKQQNKQEEIEVDEILGMVSSGGIVDPAQIMAEGEEELIDEEELMGHSCPSGYRSRPVSTDITPNKVEIDYLGKRAALDDISNIPTSANTDEKDDKQKAEKKELKAFEKPSIVSEEDSKKPDSKPKTKKPRAKKETLSTLKMVETKGDDPARAQMDQELDELEAMLAEKAENKDQDLANLALPESSFCKRGGLGEYQEEDIQKPQEIGHCFEAFRSLE